MTTTMRVPFDVGPTGRIGRAVDEYDVANQYLKVLLLTRVSERVMRPGYGAAVRDNVFEPIGDLVIQEIEDEIREAIKAWEPTVSVHEIVFDDEKGSVLEIDLLYTLNSTLGLPPTRLSVEIGLGGSVEETAS